MVIVAYLDACGVDHRLDREWGRAPRGEWIYAAVAGKRRERTRLIAASQNSRLVAPLVFQGNCNTEVVDTYFEKVLLPKGSVIVWDNARFHQPPTTAALVAAAGGELRFLPASSPTSIPSNIFGPASRPASVKTSPPPPIPSFLSPICPNFIVDCHNPTEIQFAPTHGAGDRLWIQFSSIHSLLARDAGREKINCPVISLRRK